MRAEQTEIGGRWNTVRCFACLAMIGIDWTPDEPVPITPHAQAGEVDTLMRPRTGVVQLPLKLKPAIFGLRGVRKIARRHDAVACGRDVALVGLYSPNVCLAVEDGFLDSCVEFDVAAQVEAVGNVVDVAQDLGLRAVALGPMPFLPQLVREGIRVFQAFDVAAAPGIAVPVPGASDPLAGLEGAHFEAELAQAVDRVEPADAGPHDDRIECSDVRGFFRHFRAPFGNTHSAAAFTSAGPCALSTGSTSLAKSFSPRSQTS